jgi:hypothetical protein
VIASDFDQLIDGSIAIGALILKFGYYVVIPRIGKSVGKYPVIRYGIVTAVVVKHC